ncbi:MAG: 5'-nucleotidase C-terminal domain-containing protein [Chitinophagales bacterium]|jgi:2',3'-cyclic-nucleotide 2'-phosphodiesterase (5'-nucleotidase family)|nr:5'-nucleotidase C-terminal domain-containing protein [Chitinophagales bacterium]
MNRILIFSFSFLLAACNKNFVATQYSFEEKKLAHAEVRDETMAAFIQPYKDSLDKEMNVVLAISDTILTKSVPEGDLGNLMCDLILKKSNDYSGKKVDFTMLNNGGIRIPNLPKGYITLGKIVELMPFENLIDIVSIDGRHVDSLFQLAAAKGGWQVSGARYKIKNKQATEIYIQGKPLDTEAIYTLSISDYLAQGGDNCNMLIPLPKTILNKSLRDAIVDGLKEMNERGEHVKSVMDGRVQNITD